MTGARLAFAVLTFAMLAGCSVIPETKPIDVEGPTDGYVPTKGFLKVFVKQPDDTSMLVNFDRRDWYVAEIAERIDLKEVRYVSVYGMPREVMGEVLVEVVRDPGDLTDLRYDQMQATSDERSRMDAEYDALLDALEHAAKRKELPSAPTVPGPELP